MRDVFWNGFADELEKLGVTGAYVAGRMVGRAKRLLSEPTVSLAKRTANQFTGLQGTMDARRSVATSALSRIQNAQGRPGVGAHAKELKLKSAVDQAGANSNAVSNAAHGMAGGSVHFPNISEPLRTGGYKSPAFD